MSTDDPDDYIRHTSGPRLERDGLLSGEIELPGGLPPEDDDEDEERHSEQHSDARQVGAPGWDDAMRIAERDGYVLFDPDAPGGFRALTPAERVELTDTVRAGTPPALTTSTVAESADSRRDRAGQDRGDDASAPLPDWSATDQAMVEDYDRGPWVEHSTGRSADSSGHQARELAEQAPSPQAADDSAEISRRLDEARTRLGSYTWREAVEGDQALAERREQLGRWHDDDTTAEQTDGSDDGQADALDPYCLPQCIVHVDDPRDQP